MGNAAPRAQPLTQIDNSSQYRTYLMDYSPRSMNIIFGSLIGDGKFLKSIYCKCEEGSLVVKLYRKYDPDEKLDSAEYSLRRIREAFSLDHQPNLIPYADYYLSAKNNVAFLVRQYFASNLYDRICSRPFLTTIEKKWIAFQILRALEQCHAKGICHGDIKQENIMVTSWNWVFLTDFAPFKPTYIPEDDPADYNYYFCAIDATRRGCSVAPERFYGSSTASNASAGAAAGGAGAKGTDAMMLSRLADSELSVEDVDKALGYATLPTPGGTMRSRRQGSLLQSMDIFSAGCVIAEIFLGGKPLFDLPSLLKYRTGDEEYLKNALRKIEDPELEDMLLHMLQLNPRARSSASEYLARFTRAEGNALFPAYFDSFLFRFLVLVLSRGGKVPDARVRLVCKYYGRIVKEVAGVDDPEGEEFFKLRLREGYGSDRQLSSDLLSLDDGGHVAQRILEELDQSFPGDDRKDERVKDREMTLSGTAQKKKIEKLNEQYQALTEKKKQTLLNDLPLLEDEYKEEEPASLDEEMRAKKAEADKTSAAYRKSSKSRATSREQPSQQKPWGSNRNGIVIILSLVCASLRHVQVPESKLTALYLIRYLGQYTSDEVRLQRLVPYLLEVVDDASATVRALSIRTLTFILSLVKSFPLSDASIFPQYILPHMVKFPVDSDELVRITFAECLPLLAATSRRFLEVAHSMKQQSMTAPNSTTSVTNGSSNKLNADALYLASSNFDRELNRLHKMISRFVIQLAAPDQKTSSSLVKRALLVDITRLCIFFGRERTLDVVLPQLITFLNDRDWELRGAFFDHIAGVCAFVGRVTVEQYILPCIEQALFDVQEIVITKALDCLGALCQLGLFQKNTSALADKAKMTSSLLLHPSWWIREAALKLMCFIAIQMGSVDANVFLGPLLRPFLKKSMIFLVGESEVAMLPRLRDCCRPFVSRETFDAALIASSSGTGLDPDGFVALMGGDDSNGARNSENGSSRRNGRGALTSVDSLDSYSVNRLPPPVPSSSMDALSLNTNVYEHKKNEMQGLKLMQQYVAIASMHMRSKMELAHSEQAARLMGHGRAEYSAVASNSLMSGIRKLGRSSLHVLYVPDMRFALAVAQPLKGQNLVVASSQHSSAGGMTPAASSSTALVVAGGKQTSNNRVFTGQAGAALLENLSLSLIVKMYGLVSPNLPMSSMPLSPSTLTSGAFDDSAGASAYQLQTSIDSNHFGSTSGAMAMLNLRDMYGGDNVGGFIDNHHTPPTLSPRQRIAKKAHQGLFNGSPYRESSIDPALTNPRKLLARLTALGVPPLPPDLGSLRLLDGSVYSIYAHPASPHSMVQHGGMGNSTSSGVGDRGGIASNTSSSGVGSAYGTGGYAGSNGPASSSGMGSGLGSNSGIYHSSISSYRNWRPRQNVLVAELAEHSGAVHRIGAAQDFSFLASASKDGTVKLWSIRSMNHSINQGSRSTYDGQAGVLTDMVVLDNSHSVASASSNGTVHVFRVDKVNATSGNFQTTGLREIRSEKSAVMVLDHLNNVTESLLIYATRDGTIHAWDLRQRREAWKLEVAPELGYVTCITHSLDVSWLAVGTSRGFICLWDLRFLVLIRIWRHSSHRSIHRLKPCLGLPNTLTLEETSVPLVFVAAGDGEVAVFDLSIGACRAVFRTLHVQAPEADACRCPTLLHVPIPHRSRSVLGSFLGIYGIANAFDEIAATPLSEEPSVRAILCPSLHFRGVADALITGGEDKQIRYWDIRNGKQSFTVCGNSESKSFYDNQNAPSDWWRMRSSTGPGANSSPEQSDALVSAASMGVSGGGSSSSSSNAITKPEMAWSKLSPPIITICQDASYFASSGGLSSSLAAGGGVESAVTMERRGLVPPSPAHSDCILDLTLVDLNGPVLVSSGRDGIIKVWK
ncbi:hypothetical protein Poli38472_013097 [Pythium oligandrum]|uniref:non-specific serine/threonine protein kinase n=1 Tax=Pythium oligandrum TaxID=41045 RepID=A0A8K1C2E6_PYTOL|nr:hypothetical protein Poli38472_013097 [Pythium oligandrum]|eukprot:TMW55206.1 hypothetical protein Poli38472_013097 [Pythium oligandrum]